MSRSSRCSGDGDTSSGTLWEDGERALCRTWCMCASGGRQAVLVVSPVSEHPTPGSLNRLTHEYELKDHVDDAWAARPLELVRERGQTTLVLKDPGGEPLDRLIAARPWRLERSCASRSPYRPRLATSRNAASFTRTSSRDG
jgi:hypothetical protein